MAQTLGLASATIRRHLDILQRDQLVTWTEARRPTGRPHYVYSLTDNGHERLPRQYDLLAGLLLRALSSLTPQETSRLTGPRLVDAAMSRVGHLLADEYRHQVTGRDLRQRAREVAAVLGQDAQSPDIEETDSGFRIHCYNCPFQRVAMSFPSVCRAHQQMVRDLLGTRVRRLECLAQGDSRCTYAVSRHPDS